MEGILFSSKVQTLVAVKRQVVLFGIEYQASNVTASVQCDHLLHGDTIPVFFATN